MTLIPRRRKSGAPGRSLKPKASAGDRSIGTPPTTGDSTGAQAGGSPGAKFPIVGIGASAGGLEAFTQLLGALPPDSGMGFVLVQHLDPEHESALVQILSRATTLPVTEITDNCPVLPDHVHVIPRDTSLSIVGAVLKLAPRERTRTQHRPIDSFFESLAHDQREWAVGVVLSGTASDGTLGLEAIKAEGGITFAQDNSAKHNSMPRSAEAAGCVDLVLSPVDIARELARISKRLRVSGQTTPLVAEEHRPRATTRPEAEPGDGPTPESEVSASAPDDYTRILTLLRKKFGVDFSLYKPTTIHRRISRRLVLSNHDTLEEYAGFLRENAHELDALYSDVLISVTSFFRNPEVFEVLQSTILPRLLEQGGDDPVRCWVLGCSTGQEAYSVAMSFLEVADKVTSARKLQVFATDLNDALLDKARHGLYSKSLTDDVSRERLARFFVEEGGGYRVAKAVRETVVFARHNLITDPAFSRMDLVTCRNLMIYLKSAVQQKAIPTFHYSLKPGGYLILGASESIAGFTDLFEPVDKKHKIYSRRGAAHLSLHPPPTKERSDAPSGTRPLLPLRRPGKPDLPEVARIELDAQREADRVTLNQFAPPGVLVNADLHVLQFRGPTGAFLVPPVGRATFDVLKMAREGLMMPLRSAINQARKENKAVRRENVRITQDHRTRGINLEVIPLRNVGESTFLILFEERGTSGPRRQPSAPPPARRRAPRGGEPGRIAQLESELSDTLEYLQALREQHDASHEELQASSEEIQSGNEELQSVNEELETSKEELESANEELTTVNEEMTNRLADLNVLNNDLVNLQTSTKLAILLLGRNLTIRRFSPQAERLFTLLPTDVGRPIGHIRHNLLSGDATPTPLDLEALAAAVIANVREEERGVQDNGGHWYSLRIRPYISLDNRVDGAVLVLVDIDSLKRSELATLELGVVAQRLAAIVSCSDDSIMSTDLNGIILTFNRGSEHLLGYSAQEVVGKPVTLFIPPGHVALDLANVARVGRGELVDHYDTVRRRKDGSLVDVSVTVSPLQDSSGRIVGVAKIARDITERKRLERDAENARAALLEADRQKDEFLAMLGHELRNPLSAIVQGLALMAGKQDDPVRSEELRGMMERQTGRIGVLLDQLLDMARVISGKIEITKDRIDLADVARAAIETVELSDTRQHKITLVLPPSGGALVMGDATRLTQVVENLLMNSVKYTPVGGEIGLAIEVAEDQARIIVRDTGVGLSPEFLPHAFDIFTQEARVLDRAQGGLGLGLPLVRRLVEMHAGKVSASSRGADQGSEFMVTLPRAPEVLGTSRDGQPTSPLPVQIRPRRILVVDDERANAETLAQLLEANGHQTLVVHDGAAALVAARSFQPEVVLMDLGLPGMDGYQVARSLRDEHGVASILLIAVTGYQLDAARLEQAGFDRHLIKPPNMQKLHALLAAWGGEAR